MRCKPKKILKGSAGYVYKIVYNDGTPTEWSEKTFTSLANVKRSFCYNCGRSDASAYIYSVETLTLVSVIEAVNCGRVKVMREVTPEYIELAGAYEEAGKVAVTEGMHFCPGCGKEIESPEYVRGDAMYCSKECVDRALCIKSWHQEPKEIRCHVCAKPMIKGISTIVKGVHNSYYTILFCSEECAYKYHDVMKK